MAASDDVLEHVSCADVRVFTNLVRAHQKNDDNVTHWLNRPAARTAGKCEELFQTFSAAHQRRVAALQRCLAELSSAVDKLALQAAVPDADPRVRSQLTAERAKLRHLATELSAEGIIAERTLQMFRDRCGSTGLQFELASPSP